jgi:hypothetical protein
MPDYSLVPVDHQPDFGDFSLVPVDHDPFSTESVAQPVQTQPTQNLPKSPTGSDLADVGAPLIGDGGQFSPGAPWANKAADIASKLVWNTFRGAINLAATPGAIMRPNPYPPGSEQAVWYDNQRQQLIDKAAPAMAFAMLGAGAPMAEGGAVGALGGKLSRLGTESPKILPEELAGQTRTQIRDLAVDKGLVPKGDPLHPGYPRRWNDPVTNERRLRLDRGHVESETGQPFFLPNAAVDHVHAYDIDGNPIIINEDNHIPTTGE